MNEAERKKILVQVKDWFRTVILPNHIANTVKLVSSEEFNINPFLAPYLAAFFTGELTPESISKALLYPRVLGTSITTSFGTNIQRFITDVLINSFGSIVPGIDIEFIDSLDGRRKYCQCKLGPNTINRDDVVTIKDHFRAARNLGRTNNVQVVQHDLVVGILYGELGNESAHYKTLRDVHDHPLYIGSEFWHRLTGDENFYRDLRLAIAEVATEAKGSSLLAGVERELAATPFVQHLAGR